MSRRLRGTSGFCNGAKSQSGCYDPRCRDEPPDDRSRSPSWVCALSGWLSAPGRAGKGSGTPGSCGRQRATRHPRAATAHHRHSGDLYQPPTAGRQSRDTVGCRIHHTAGARPRGSAHDGRLAPYRLRLWQKAPGTRQQKERIKPLLPLWRIQRAELLPRNTRTRQATLLQIPAASTLRLDDDTGHTAQPPPWQETRRAKYPGVFVWLKRPAYCPAFQAPEPLIVTMAQQRCRARLHAHISRQMQPDTLRRCIKLWLTTNADGIAVGINAGQNRAGKLRQIFHNLIPHRSPPSPAPIAQNLHPATI